ncbi:hypothetical protein M9H77_26790 [Catharanthus roseus]|uniref:Uncharacterized protein n=1 Tax=Catharanthus roseus TaxID=4058 RepID=A0ACC0AC29_CATRO|nr:hypothetical protein M9H77_26790 [Catharanthus roseus]
MENEGSLCYKLYKTISFLPATSFLFFDFIINESNSFSFSIFCDRIQSQSFNFLTITCGTKPNHGMKAKGEGMEKELSIGYEGISISLSLNPFLLCHELSFKELKLFLEFDYIQIPCDELEPLIVDETWTTLLLGNFHRFQFYHFYFKEFMWLLFYGKKMNGSFKVLKAYVCDLVKTIFENGAFELTLKNLDEKNLVYSIAFIDFLLKGDV